VNNETQTLREIINTRFLELGDHIAALDSILKQTEPTKSSYYFKIDKASYDIAALLEGLEEIEQRLIAIEKYESNVRFIVRQGAFVALSVIITLWLIYYVF